MNNFFLKERDFDLFKKALRSTKNEPVVINILSTDSSLEENSEKAVLKNAPAPRKNQSAKFEASPFGRFFGPRKPQPTNVDMKDFSSWKNKNYRQAEKAIGEEESKPVKFSMSDFMNERFKDSRYHDIDQLKSETQKPINELSTSDPLYKRFSLDSYMHKLEEQTNVKDKFKENDDILEPFNSDITADVVLDSSQDENFGFGSDVNLEKVVFDDHLQSGEKYRFETEELDKVKARLEKMQREANNIKDKPTQKVIDGSELSDVKDDGLDLSKLLGEDEDLVDDIEKLNSELSDSEDNMNLSKDKPKVEHKRFFEIKKNSKDEDDDVSQQTEETDEKSDEVSDESEQDETKPKDENVDDEAKASDEEKSEEKTEESSESESEEKDKETSEESDEPESDKNKSDENDSDAEESTEADVAEEKDVPESILKTSDVLTKADFKDITDDFMEKFSQLYKKDETSTDTNVYVDDEPYYDPYADDLTYGTTQQTTYVDPVLQSQLQQLIDANQRNDQSMQEKLRLAELEKENLSRQYESKIRAMEQDFKQSYEDIKNKIYLDKLDRDVKLQEVESKFKKKAAQIEEKEKETSKKRLVGEMFKKELKSNVDICNLEMDKKLLEVATGDKIEPEYEQPEVVEPIEEVVEEPEIEEVVSEPIQEEPVEEVVEEPEQADEEYEEEEEVVEEEKPKTTKKKTSTKKSSSTKSTKRRRTAVTTKKRAPRSPNRRKIDSDIIGGIDFD